MRRPTLLAGLLLAGPFAGCDAPEPTPEPAAEAVADDAVEDGGVDHRRQTLTNDFLALSTHGSFCGNVIFDPWYVAAQERLNAGRSDDLMAVFMRFATDPAEKDRLRWAAAGRAAGVASARNIPDPVRAFLRVERTRPGYVLSYSDYSYLYERGDATDLAWLRSARPTVTDAALGRQADLMIAGMAERLGTPPAR